MVVYAQHENFLFFFLGDKIVYQVIGKSVKTFLVISCGGDAQLPRFHVARHPRLSVGGSAVSVYFVRKNLPYHGLVVKDRPGSNRLFQHFALPSGKTRTVNPLVHIGRRKRLARNPAPVERGNVRDVHV